MKTIDLKLYLIISVLFCISVQSQVPQYLWTKTVPGSSTEDIYLLHPDANGNLFYGGQCQGTGDLDPGPGVINVTAPTNSTVAFLCKVNPAGQFLWVRWIVLNGEFNSLCLTGPANGSLVDFIWKLDPNGNFVTAGTFGGGNNGISIPLIKFNGQNLYCTTHIWGICDLDPGPATISYTSTGISDPCLVKLDLNLNLQWAAQFKTSQAGKIYDFEFNQSNEVYLSLFAVGTGTIDIDPGSAVYPYAYTSGNQLLLKLAASGDLVWHRSFSTSLGNSNRLTLEHLELDGTQNIFLAGRSSGTIDMDPGTSSQLMITPPFPMVKPVVLRLDSSGNFISYDSLVFFQDFKVNRDTLFFAGSFQGTPDFDPSTSVYTLTSQGSIDCFILALNKNYALQWLHTFGGISAEYVYKIAFSPSNELYVSGGFDGTTDFDPGPGINNFTAQAGSDGFVSKFSPCADMPFNGTSPSVCAGQSTTLASLNSSQVTWYQNSTGGKAVGTGSAFTTSTLGPGTFTFFAASASCTLMPRTKFIALVNALPSITVSAPGKTICPGQPVVLIASGAQSFSWTAGPANSSYSVSPLQTTSYTVTGEDTLTLCKNFTSISVTVSTCTDVNESALANIRLFPNPSNGRFNLKVQSPVHFKVFTAQGIEILSATSASENSEVDLSLFPAGVYIFVINSSENSRIIKVVREN
jgi:hypothetical protein